MLKGASDFMATIELTQGKEAIVDERDTHLKKWKWFYQNGYACRNAPTVNGKRGAVYMQHVIVGRPLNGLEVDHINGIRHDNRRSNLRFVTHRENGMNRKEHRGEKYKTSKFIGVSLDKRSGRWQAMITINAKQKNLGLHETEEKAHEAYRNVLKSLSFNENHHAIQGN